MDLKRRITLYLFGLIIGGGAAYLFFGQRLTNMGWMPSERIRLRLEATLVKASQEAETSMKRWPTALPAVRKSISTAEIQVGRTRRSGDSLFYEIHADVAGRPARMIVLVSSDLARDTTATLWELKER